MLNRFRRILMMAAALVASMVALGGGKAAAQECMTGEVKIFAGSYAPRNWAFADGQLLAISENQTLYSVLGTVYGGDGRSTFGLPDLRGRAPVSAGQGPGLSHYGRGDKGGVEQARGRRLTSHSHAEGMNGGLIESTTNNDFADGDQWMSVVQPYLAVNYIVCMQGFYPSRQ